jgi:arylsulfatase A-like enzyme
MMTHVRDFNNRTPDSGQRFNSSPTKLPEKYYCDNWITENAIQMIRNVPNDKPWHLVVNFVCPHDPWDVTESMKKRWVHIDFPPPRRGNLDTIEDEIKVRQNYAAMLENTDRNVGIILDEIRQRGDFENTIVIYSSDHGEMLGDFGQYGKSVPHRGSISIPLVIQGPEIEKGIVSEQLVELQDITSTIIDFSGGIMAEAVDSKSLKPILSGISEIHREFQVSSIDLLEQNRSKWDVISDETYKLIRFHDDKIELYNKNDDPWEENNLANILPSISSKLLKQLNQEITSKE